MNSDMRTLPELTKDAANYLGEMMRNEFRLARAETADHFKDLGGDVFRIVLGAAIAGAAVTLALFAGAYALAEILPMWMAALAVAAIGAAIAYALISSGRKSIARQRLTLPRTAQQLSTDISLLKEKVTP